MITNVSLKSNCRPLSTMAETIKERIKEVRNTLNLSQKDISSRIGIARTYWTSLENGNRDITGKIILSLLVTFDVSADWLLTGKNSMFLHYNTDDPYRIDFEKKTHSNYSHIVEVIELMEKLNGSNPAYDIYLKEINEVTKTILVSSRKNRNINFEKLSNALIEDFKELVHEYFMMTIQSERTRKLKPFEPSRYFAKVKLEL